jgi:hypothetical protein
VARTALRHQDEQFLAPDGHPLAARHDDGFAPQEVRDIVGMKLEPLARTLARALRGRSGPP